MLSRRFHLFTLSGSSVSLHISWIPIAPLVSWTSADMIFPFLVPELSTAAYWQMAITGTVGLLLSILVREAAHLLVARRAAIRIGGMTVYVFGGVGDRRDNTASIKQEFVLMIAGSLVAFILGFAILVLLFQGAQATTPLSVSGVLFYLGFANWGLALLNLVPASPFHGGRVIRAALIRCLDRRWADRITTGLGTALAILLALIGAGLVMRGGLPIGLLSLSTGILLYVAAPR